MKRMFGKRWIASALVLCLLVGVCPSVWAETVPAAAADTAAEEKNPVLQTIQHLKTVNWRELPKELRQFIDETGWQELQRQLKDLDWRGALDTLKSFFTDSEWGEVGREIERRFLQLYQEGADKVRSLEDALRGLSLDDFIGTLKDAAESALMQAKNCAEGALAQAESYAEQLRTTVEDATQGIRDTVSGILHRFGF